MTSNRPTADSSLDLQPWLAEIDALKQQVATAKQDADAARESADRWRQLYTREAEQRRRNLDEAQQTVERLQSELAQFVDVGRAPREASQLSAELPDLTAEELRDRLVAALDRVETLTQRLAALETNLQLERAEHAKTRSDLTAALGDTVEVFARAKEKLAQTSALPPQLDRK
ncbi:MAG: hypothetical protein ACFB9N_05450 [Geitlerinemataceae cyanobacterium]